MLRLDSTGVHDSHDTSYSCSEAEDPAQEEAGVMLEVAIPDGRMEVAYSDLENMKVSRSLVSVSVLDTGNGETQFSVRFASNHHSFSLARSVTIRNTEAFYFLQRCLSSMHPYRRVPALPPRLLLCLSSTQKQCDTLARWLQQVLSTPEYLSNKAVHLFLQTGLSVDKIRLNIEGLRDDDVPAFPIVDKRTNSRNGFSEIFGDFL